METLQAQNITTHIKEQITTLETLVSIIKAEPVATAMLLQEEHVYRHARAKEGILKRTIQENMEKARFYIWNRAFDYKLDYKHIIPSNLKKIKRLINQHEADVETVTEVARLAKNELDVSEMLKWAFYLFQRSTIEGHMRIDTHTFREREPIQNVLIDMMFFTHQKLERPFGLETAVDNMRDIADTDLYCSPDQGFRLAIKYDHVIIDIAEPYLKALQDAQPQDYTPPGKKIGIFFDDEPVPEYI